MTACEAISILGDKVANGITACTAEWDVIEEAIQNEYLKFVDQLDPDCEYDIWCYAWLCSHTVNQSILTCLLTVDRTSTPVCGITVTQL